MGFGDLGYNDEDQYPSKYFATTTLGSGVQLVNGGAEIKVHSYIFTAGVSGGTAILRHAGGAAEYTRVRVLSGASQVVPMGFAAISGLEVLTTVSGGDFGFSLWYK